MGKPENKASVRPLRHILIETSHFFQICHCELYLNKLRRQTFGKCSKMNIAVKYLVFIVHLCCLSHACFAAFLSAISAIQLWAKVTSIFDVRWFSLSAFKTAGMHWFALWGWPIVGTNFSERVQIFVPGRNQGSKLNVTPTRGWGLGMKIISLLLSLLSFYSPSPLLPLYYSAMHDLPHHPRCTASGYDHCWWVSLVYCQLLPGLEDIRSTYVYHAPHYKCIKTM